MDQFSELALIPQKRSERSNESANGMIESDDLKQLMDELEEGVQADDVL